MDFGAPGSLRHRRGVRSWYTLLPMRIHCFVVLLTFVASAMAQAWSIIARAPSVGSAGATVFQGLPFGQSSTLPIGPVAAGSFLAASVTYLGSSASAAGTWTPSVGGQVAPLAFTVSATAGAQVGPGAVAGSALAATIDLLLNAPQPVAGRLVVRMLGTAPTQPADFLDLDVGADGSIEFRIATGASNPGTVDVPLSIPATGAVVRVAFRVFAQVAGAPYSLSTGVALEARFVPGEPAIAVFDTTGAGAAVGIDHPIGSNIVTLSIGTPAQTPYLMAIGALPILVPLLPTVTVLVTPDVTLTGLGSITLPLPPFPGGTALYFQGLVIDTAGTPRSTPSVRALWP
jgi:hypothetical protein